MNQLPAKLAASFQTALQNNMDFHKLIDNLKHESRMFCYEDKYSEHYVLEAIIKSLEDALDNKDSQPYIEMDNDEIPF